MSHTTRELARQIRIDSLRMVHRARASHVGSALSIADLLAVLYGSVLRVDPDDPYWSDRDRFILSKGHACVGVYAALSAREFFAADMLLTYGEDGSSLMNHISHEVPGVEFSTGSLGHGLPFGVGKALAAKRFGAAWRTFVITSDGEWDEGSNWEAALFASHHCLDNLVVVIDCNNLQSLATVEDTLRLEPLADKFKAFGWATTEIDGHDHDALDAALSTTPWDRDRPSVVIARTTKGRGVDFMENQVKFHYSPPNDEELTIALAQLGSAP